MIEDHLLFSERDQEFLTKTLGKEMVNETGDVEEALGLIEASPGTWPLSTLLFPIDAVGNCASGPKQASP